MNFERRLYFSIGLVMVLLVLFSCTIRQYSLDEQNGEPGEALAQNEERLPLPPIQRAGRRTSPTLDSQIDAPGPQGPFSEFQKVTAETLASLPKVEDLRGRTDAEVHHSPPELMAVSPSLGRIAQTLREAPELIPQGIEFYDACARRDDILTAVRVLCLRNLNYWTRQMPDVMQLEANDYPEDLWKIVESLPPVTQ